MTNPLLGLDGKRKYVFSKGEEHFYLKVVASREEAAKKIYEGAFMSLESIAVDSEEQMSGEVSKKGYAVKSSTPRPADEFITRMLELHPKLFETESNRVMFVLENEAGNLASAILITINDPVKRKDLKVSPEVGTFIYVSDISTNAAYRGKNLFSGAFDKVITVLAKPAIGLQLPIRYSVSMTATTAVKEDGQELEYVKNLPRYSDMWQKRFTNNELQNRHQSFDNLQCQQVGLERMPLEEFLNSETKEVDELKVCNLIKGQKLKLSGTNMKVRGLYLEGTSREYCNAKDLRKRLLAKREKGGIRKNKKTKWLSVLEGTKASSMSIDLL